MDLDDIDQILIQEEDDKEFIFTFLFCDEYGRIQSLKQSHIRLLQLKFINTY